MCGGIPLERVAAAALKRAREAQNSIEDYRPASYEREQYEGVKRAITGTVELLTLICGEPRQEPEDVLALANARRALAEADLARARAERLSDPRQATLEVVPNPATIFTGHVAEVPPEFFVEPAPHRDPRDETIQF